MRREGLGVGRFPYIWNQKLATFCFLKENEWYDSQELLTPKDTVTAPPHLDPIPCSNCSVVSLRTELQTHTCPPYTATSCFSLLGFNLCVEFLPWRDEDLELKLTPTYFTCPIIPIQLYIFFVNSYYKFILFWPQTHNSQLNPVKPSDFISFIVETFASPGVHSWRIFTLWSLS